MTKTKDNLTSKTFFDESMEVVAAASPKMPRHLSK